MMPRPAGWGGTDENEPKATSHALRTSRERIRDMSGMAPRPLATAMRGEGAPRPRHLDLAANLRRLIASGEFGVGDALPTERTIAKSEGLSRGTVREALRLLERDGMIERRQGSGTRVTAIAPRQFVQPVESLEALLAAPADTYMRLICAEPHQPDADYAAQCRMPPDRMWMRLDLRRYASGTDLPLSHSYAFCPPELEVGPEDVDPLGPPIYALVERKLGICPHRGAMRIEAIATPDALAEALQVGPGAPAIRIVRSYTDGEGRLYQVSVTTHPAGRYAFEASLEM